MFGGTSVLRGSISSHIKRTELQTHTFLIRSRNRQKTRAASLIFSASAGGEWFNDSCTQCHQISASSIHSVMQNNADNVALCCSFFLRMHNSGGMLNEYLFKFNLEVCFCWRSVHYLRAGGGCSLIQSQLWGNTCSQTEKCCYMQIISHSFLSFWASVNIRLYSCSCHIRI